MVFRALKREKLRKQAFPTHWMEILKSRVPHYFELTASDRQKWLSDIQIFLWEKRFEGCAGFVVDDEVRLIIAAQACLLILHKDVNYFPNVSSILVYPSNFKVKEHEVPNNGTSPARPTVLSGQAWSKDYVILSWDDTLSGVENSTDGNNVVFHEFAHHLDATSGRMDGIPLLPLAIERNWRAIFNREFKQHEQRIGEGEETLLGSYAATNKAEFFAVTTEVFFERPQELKSQHEKLYQILKAYYEQDLLIASSADSRRVSPQDWPSYLTALTEPLSAKERVLKKGEQTLRAIFNISAIVVVPFLVLAVIFPEAVDLIARASLIVWTLLLFVAIFIHELKKEF